MGLYLKEEIQAEGLTRSVSNFSRFLQTAAATNGEQVIFSNVASDAQVPARTVREYYQILEDTLIGRLLPAFRETSKRKAMSTAKFYYFDVGVANALLGRWAPEPGSPEFGRALKHYVFCEITAAMEYWGIEGQLFFWRSLSQMEVDFVIELPGKRFVAIEVKGTGRVSPKDFRGLRALQEDIPTLKRLVVCLEEFARRTEDGVDIFPVEDFLNYLWRGEITA